MQALPDFAGDSNWKVQREIEALTARLVAAKGSLQHEQRRGKAMEERLRQAQLQMRQRQLQTEARSGELDTETHLCRMLQQSEVNPPHVTPCLRSCSSFEFRSVRASS